MANGTESFPVSRLKHGASHRWKPIDSAFCKKIAVQFTPDQFARINAFADGKAVSFAAAVRRLIFENEMLP